ncbi:MAG: ABC transporter substrate-binding protein [Thermomicrobiales bacterium]
MNDRETSVHYALSRRQLLRYAAVGSVAGLGALLAACGGSSPTPTSSAQTTTSSASSTASSASTSVTTASQAATRASQSASPTSAAAASASPSTAANATPSGTPATSGQATAALPTNFTDAPSLADQVKSGKLPPVAQRLPKDPLVITPVERVGKYGGAWRAALLGGADTLWLARTIGYENLVRWDPEWKNVLPNIATSFQGSADAKEYTFKLRQGIRWSDGEPFTADDILFWYEDVDTNTELTPNRGTNPATVTKLDDYTVKFTFAQPNGLYLQTLATLSGDSPTHYPAHYMKQFHKKYADPAKLEQLMKDNSAEDWVKLFRLKGSSVPGTPYDARWSNPDLPTIFAWRIVDPYGKGARVTAERNPYYWKVDTAGNQLPYIDKVTYDVAQDQQVLVLKAANGEIDMQDRNIATLANKAVLSDNQQKGQYHFFDTIPAIMNTSIVALNLTHKDPVKRQVFQNKDFRVGLSYAINRQEIIDTVYVSQGEPWQGAPRKETAYYDEEMAKQYTEYDIVKANASLDKAFAQKDGQGFRLGPDGKRISIVVEVATSLTDEVDAMKLLVGYWQKVGIDAQLKTEDRALFDTRRNANEHDCAVWQGAGGLDVIPNPPYYFPWSTRADYAQAWVTYYTNPSGAGAQTPPEEPPAPTKLQMDLYRQISQTSDTDKQTALMKQILAIAKDQFYVIGISLPANGYGVQKNTFHNVPKQFPDATTYPTPGPTNPCQYFSE